MTKFEECQIRKEYLERQIRRYQKAYTDSECTEEVVDALKVRLHEVTKIARECGI